jgi:phosphoserine phosphatase RsbU/P
MTLRTRILLLVISLLVVAVVATSAVLAWTSNAALLAQTEADGVLIAHLLARSVEFADDIVGDVEDMIDGQMVVEATLAAQLVALGEAHGVPPRRSWRGCGT